MCSCGTLIHCVCLSVCVCDADIDECVKSSCHAMADCINFIGGFECKCRDGFTGDGYQCEGKRSQYCVDEDLNSNSFCGRSEQPD